MLSSSGERGNTAHRPLRAPSLGENLSSKRTGLQIKTPNTACGSVRSMRALERWKRSTTVTDTFACCNPNPSPT